MKKTVFILAIVLVLAFMFTLSASATIPEQIKGLVPLWSVTETDETFEYDMCDEWLVGHIVQPLVVPGFAVHGTFTAGDIPDPGGECQFTTTNLEGTCEFTLIPVEDFTNPESKRGRAVINRCTGDLKGIHGRYVIDEWYNYDAWYHLEP
jgi:hypothetical protein